MATDPRRNGQRNPVPTRRRILPAILISVLNLDADVNVAISPAAVEGENQRVR